MAIETVTAVYNRYEVIQDAEGNDVKTNNKVETKSASVGYNFGDDLEDAVNIFGREAFYYHGVSSLRVGLQNHLRSCIAQGMTDDEVKEAVETWEWPSGKPRGKSKVERVREIMSKMSEEERNALIADMEQ